MKNHHRTRKKKMCASSHVKMPDSGIDTFDLYAAPPARTTAAVYFPAKYPQLVWRHFRIPTCVCAQVGGRLCSREFLVFVLRAAANVLAVCVS